MTRTDDLPAHLENTEQRIRAAMKSVASSVTEADLQRQLLTDRAEHRPRHRRQTVMLAAASAVILLGGAVTILSIRGGNPGDVAEPNTPSPAAIVTLSALPDGPWSCPYTGFKEYGQEAAQQGGGLVTGVLRPTGVHREEVDQQAGGYYSEVQITVISVLTGQVSTGDVTGYVQSSIDTTAAPPAGSQPPQTETPAEALDYEGTAGWGTDGAFLGMLLRRNDGTFYVNPVPLIGDRAVVGLGCWSAGGLPVTRERVDLVLAGSPPVTISAPVELVTVQDIRSSLN